MASHTGGLSAGFEFFSPRVGDVEGTWSADLAANMGKNCLRVG